MRQDDLRVVSEQDCLDLVNDLHALIRIKRPGLQVDHCVCFEVGVLAVVTVGVADVMLEEPGIRISTRHAVTPEVEVELTGVVLVVRSSSLHWFPVRKNVDLCEVVQHGWPEVGRAGRSPDVCVWLCGVILVES